MSRSRQPLLLALAGAALAATGLAAPRAWAQLAQIPDNDWRHEDRHDALTDGDQPQKGYFELRLGPYLPTSIDRDPALRGKTPFRSVFGLDCSQTLPGATHDVTPRIYFGLEADYLLLRLPHVGGLGLGAGWGFTRFSNQARFSHHALKRCSSETTSLTIMPMHASLVLRVDELMRHTGIPIVPYGKFGAGVSWWRVANDGGTEGICGTTPDAVDCRAGATPLAHGSGLLPTLHLAAGAMLSLHFLEPESASKLRQSGIGHAYLFGELYSDAIPLSTRVLRVGTTSWVAGLALDL